MTLKEKVETALSYESSVESWRKDYQSEQFRFCDQLNLELFGKRFNRSERCECIEDFFLLLKHKNKKQFFEIMANKVFHLKPGIVIQGFDFPEGLTSSSPDSDLIKYLKRNKKNIKHFVQFPDNWEEIVDSFEEGDEDDVQEIALKDMKVEDLKKFAEENGIELTATKKADIVKQIEEALEAEKGEGDEGSEGKEGSEE